MKCTNCQAEIDNSAKFCPICGHKVETAQFCSNCGTKLNEGDKFCPKCGTPRNTLEKKNVESQKESEKAPAIQSTTEKETINAQPRQYQNNETQIKQNFSQQNSNNDDGYILKCFKHYTDFSGRARRKEFWTFYLFNLIITGILYTIDCVIIDNSWTYQYTLISLFYSLAISLPTWAVGVRRLHDIGKSGLNMLFILIPFVGAIILIVWWCKEGDPNNNVWGPNPKAEEQC